MSILCAEHSIKSLYRLSYSTFTIKEDIDTLLLARENYDVEFK